MQNEELKGFALLRYLMERFNFTAAEALASMREHGQEVVIEGGES